jgi:hypothetical protein
MNLVVDCDRVPVRSFVSANTGLKTITLSGIRNEYVAVTI